MEEWDALTLYLDQWLERRPHPFDPIWQSGDEDYGFPEMWYANDCHGRSIEVKGKNLG